MNKVFLSVSLDPKIRDKNSDVYARMKTYADMCDELHILALVPAQEEWMEQEGNLCIYGVKGRSKVTRLVKGFLKALSLTKEKEFTGIITQDAFFLGLVGLALRRLREIPVAVSIYGSNILDSYWRRESLQTRLYALIGHFTLPRVDVVQTDTRALVPQLEERFSVKAVWKPMVPKNIADLRVEDREYDRTPLKILFIGRMEEQKNIPLHLEIIQRVKERCSDAVHFTMIGTGAREREVEKASGDIMQWISSVDREEIPKVFADHDVFLLVSYYEGFARVTMEAAASGMPIIATRVGGIASIVEDGVSGRIFKQETEADTFADTLCTLAEDRDDIERMSKAIQENFWKHFSENSLKGYQQELFNALVEAKKGQL